MSNDKLIIPKICKAGFNLRDDTYSGKLAYVIYKDAKNVWRKATSWESWRQKPGQKIWKSKRVELPDGKIEWQRYDEIIGPEVEPLEFENVPTEGFVLNRKVGGHSTGWNHRQTYARVWDPRGFEFEVNISNLLFILQETDCTRGKGLLGEFVYAFDGKDLVLLPCGSQDYRESQKFTDMQSNKISAKDLIPGATYKTKAGKEVVYMGRLPYFNHLTYLRFGRTARDKKRIKRSLKASPEHIFFIEKDWQNKSVFSPTSPSSIGELVSPQAAPDYAALAEEYSKSEYTKNGKVVLDKVAIDHCIRGYDYVAEKDGKKFIVTTDKHYNYGSYAYTYSIKAEGEIEILEDGFICSPLQEEIMWSGKDGITIYDISIK